MVQNEIGNHSLSGTALPVELARQAETLAEHARREGLDFYPTIFELFDTDQMNQIAAYGGFPQRYPHWRFGMEYERLRKQHTYGLGKIFEMVINNDPCYAYLVRDSSFVDKKTVIAHVYAHCDFFKNNVWFTQTNRRMMDEMANHATRMRRYIERYGLEEVEKFIDVCHSLENLIDPHSVFIRRQKDRNQRIMERPAREDRPDRATRFPAKEYMDRYINPPKVMAEEEREAREQHERERGRLPARPLRDIMLFLLNHAPMQDWQADVLAIIREEAYYFAPQGMTKIMNEGWASYWHSTIMTNYGLRAEIGRASCRERV